jgi:hypothetical protein
MYASFTSLNDRIDVWISRWKELVNSKIAELNNKTNNSTRMAIEIKEK